VLLSSIDIGVKKMGHFDSANSDDPRLTPVQLKIVQVIEESLRRDGHSPSMQEIADGAGLASTSSVSYQLSKLERQGVVAREPRRPRTIKLCRRPGLVRRRFVSTDRGPGQGGDADGDALAQVPMMGRIAAGTGVTATELPDEVLPLPRLLVGYGDLMMLTVTGESMSGAAIADGDWVVVRRQDSADNGDIVAAMLDSDTEESKAATVKTYRRRDGHAWLIPHNPAFTPIPADNAGIIGKVVAVLRRT
jgi:repressor LexA